MKKVPLAIAWAPFSCLLYMYVVELTISAKLGQSMFFNSFYLAKCTVFKPLAALGYGQRGKMV